MGEAGNKKIAVFSDHFRSLIGEGGGVDRCQLRLARYFSEIGYPVDAVALDGSGWLDKANDENFRFVVLDRSSTAATKWTVLRVAGTRWREFARPFITRYKLPSGFLYVPAMMEYLRQSRPRMLISAGNWENIAWSMAKSLAGSDTTLVVTQRNHLSSQLEDQRGQGKARRRDMGPLVSRWYRNADAVVSINQHMASDMQKVAGIPAAKNWVIPNPVIDDQVQHRSKEPVEHPWMSSDILLLVSVGRLTERKDHATLIEAIRKIRNERDVRLIIVGDGPERSALERQIQENALSDCVDLVGFDNNPYRYLSRADVFVLSSRYEGFGNVLAEALACGCPVVSTDCPSGPNEILDGGRYGRLVPVGDSDAMAGAIKGMLDKTHDRELLKSRGYEYSVQAAADQYLRIGF